MIISTSGTPRTACVTSYKNKLTHHIHLPTTDVLQNYQNYTVSTKHRHWPVDKTALMDDLFSDFITFMGDVSIGVRRLKVWVGWLKP